MIKRLVFDIDGTLIAGVSFRKAEENILRRAKMFSNENLEKLEFAISDYEKHFNNYNKKDFLEHINNLLNVNLEQNFMEDIIEECKGIVTDTSDKMLEMLNELSLKYEMVLLSNFFEEVQLGKLNKMGIGKFFTEFYGEKLTKPNKQVYIDACKDRKPHECVMIGDTFKIDIEPAREIGMHTIYINPRGEDVKYQDIVSISKVEDLTDEIICKFNKKELFV